MQIPIKVAQFLKPINSKATDGFPSAITWVVPTDDVDNGFEMDTIETMEVDGWAMPALPLP